MNIKGLKPILLAGSLAICTLVACNSNNSKQEEKKEPKKDSSAKTGEKEKEKEEAKRPPIINIMDTVSEKRLVIYMKDSAASFERVGLKLGEIYGNKLGAVLKKNGLKMTGAPMAWYTKTKAPFFFEAGVPVDKGPKKLPAGCFTRQITVDSATVAHFHGPYDMLPLAYDAVKDYMKDRKKKAGGKPYEIYIDDPMEKDGKMKDPYRVQTDIVFPWK
ncbi:MAG: hypothetical protein QM791_10140 [Ferruginibacter sp.]